MTSMCFESKTDQYDPPIFFNIKKFDSLSFSTVYGLGGLGQSLLNSLTTNGAHMRHRF
jgi:hypothetical protein